MDADMTSSRRGPMFTPLRALVAGVVAGVVVTAVVSAHDSSSDAPIADAEIVRPTQVVLAPGEQLADVAPVGGPDGEILLDQRGRVLAFDPSKMTADAVAEFNRLAALSGTSIDTPDDRSAAVIVYHEHLPELYAVGALVALEPGDAQLARFCTSDTLAAGTCVTMSAAGLTAAEARHEARRVNPATFRPTPAVPQPTGP